MICGKTLLTFDINYFLLSFLLFLEHSWNCLEYRNSISVLNSQKTLTGSSWYYNGDFMPHMKGYVLKSQINYWNGPKCFPNFCTVKIVKLMCDLYTNDRYVSLFPRRTFPSLSTGWVHFHFRGGWCTFFIFILFLIEIPISKQWRPWSDGAFCGIWSGSALFASVPKIGRQAYMG